MEITKDVNLKLTFLIKEDIIHIRKRDSNNIKYKGCEGILKIRNTCKTKVLTVSRQQKNYYKI